MPSGIVQNVINPACNSDALKQRYDKVLNNVANMLDRNALYSTWIYFQLGNDNSKAVTFNSSSQDKDKNLIANLNIEKTGNGIANKITITIYYDPFNYGQNTTDKIEILDQYIAQAMAESFDNSMTNLIGKVQYGYNTNEGSDADLVSPVYTFFLSEASSNVNYDSGIVEYNFTGTSMLAADCDFATSFDEIKDEKVLLAVGKILYKYYGDSDHPPIAAISNGITPVSGVSKCRIDISETDIQKSQTISEEKTAITTSPFAYCKSLLDKYNLTQAELDSGVYNDTSKLSVTQLPRYNISITDHEGSQTIHIVHVSPDVTVDGKLINTNTNNSLKLNYVFSWGMKNENLQNKNIVISWKPQVDLYSYLTKQSLHLRYERLKELAEKDPDKYKKTFEELAQTSSEEVLEMYDAEMEIIGIPADPPLCAEVEVIPRILENVSRTAGIYVIEGAVDSISSNGSYVSTLKLLRKRSIDGTGIYDPNKTAQQTKTTIPKPSYNIPKPTAEEEKNASSYNRRVDNTNAAEELKKTGVSYVSPSKMPENTRVVKNNENWMQTAADKVGQTISGWWKNWKNKTHADEEKEKEKKKYYATNTTNPDETK